MFYRAIFLILTIAATQVFTQTTEFIYQGQLQSSAAVANGNFDFEFALFDAQGGGSQLGSTQTRNGVGVANGIFSVTLDFGSSFPGAARYLEIRVRQSGSGSFTALSPRQPIASAPYAVKSITSDSSTVALNALTANNAVNAQTAINLSGPLTGDVTGTQNSTTVGRLQGRTVANTAPTAGQVLKYNGTQWEPAADNAGSGGGGTITGVVTNAGLTGGGTSGSVTVGLADGGVTDAKIVSVGGSKVTGAVANSTQLGGIAANQYVQTSDLRLADQRSPTAGSSNYIQNSAASQGSANFNFSGNGTVAGTLSATTVNAITQFTLDGARILTAGGNPMNLFAGFGAGVSSNGSGNAFFGSDAGNLNTTGFNNAFFGRGAGQANTANGNSSYFGAGAGVNATGPANSFFGSGAGQKTTGSGNSFFGVLTGQDNTTGNSNSFYGGNAGFLNTTAENNSFFGSRAGRATTSGGNNTYIGENSGLNSTGTNNAFLGKGSGTVNVAGSSNTLIGYNAEVSTGALTYATAIGADTVVSSSNSVVLGRTADTVRVPGVVNVTGGTDAELGSGGYIIAGAITGANLVIDNNEIMARDNGGTNTLFLNADGGNVSIGTNSSDQRLTVNGNASKVGGGTWAVFSDERLKNINGLYSFGLDAIRKLNPIRFEYKPDNALGLVSTGQHIGFSAQEVQEVIPEAVTTTSSGYLQINSDPILWAMLNAVKEQQKQIEKQDETIKRQQAVIDALRSIVCEKRRKSSLCKAGN